MKIGIVLPGFSADVNDWCIPALYTFVRTLAEQNKVHVYALEYPFKRAQYDFFSAKINALNGRHRGKLYAPVLWSRALTAVFSENRRSPFDLLHAFWVNESGLIALVAAGALHVPMVASVAGGELVGLTEIGYGGQLHWIEKNIVDWVMQRADRITVGSRYLRSLVARWRPDALVAPLGVDTQKFSPIAARAGRGAARIINVASLLAVKHQELLLEALSQLKSNAELEIVGAGDRKEFLLARAEAMNISACVRLAGALPHDALPQKYQEGDLFVQSSRHEAQGMAVLEAAASGMAIVGTPVGVLPELAERGAAIATRDWDASAFADAIERGLAARRELGGRAREIAEEIYSLQAVRDRWMDLYHSVGIRCDKSL